MADESGPTYTFGDNRRAGDRLELLARVFEPSSAALLERVGTPRPSLAVDLGCGPGHTTRLVAETTRAARTIGLDQSAAFIERARADAADGTAFAVHDVSTVPFPCDSPDLVFARYVLAHLPDPMAAVADWSNELAAAGRLVLDEVEDIATDQATFARYLEIVAQMMASRGGELYIGRRLADRQLFDDEGSVHSQRATIAPPSSVVAQMFRMNLETWRTDPWVTDNVDPADLDRLHRELSRLSTDERVGEIVWTHRQVVYVRAA
jgi:trans-aconitate 2-methyltransferase